MFCFNRTRRNQWPLTIVTTYTLITILIAATTCLPIITSTATRNSVDHYYNYLQPPLWPHSNRHFLLLLPPGCLSPLQLFQSIYLWIISDHYSDHHSYCHLGPLCHQYANNHHDILINLKFISFLLFIKKLILIKKNLCIPNIVCFKTGRWSFDRRNYDY